MSTNGFIVYLSAADCQHTSQHCSLLLCQHSAVYLGSNQVQSIKLVLCINQQLIVNKLPSAVLFFLSTKYRPYGQTSLNNAFFVSLSAADCQQISQHCSSPHCQQSTVYNTGKQASILLVLCNNQYLIVKKLHNSDIYYFVNKVRPNVYTSK